MSITLWDGKTMPLLQALELYHLMKEMEPGKSHWHFNDCGCCLTLHGRDTSYVIGADGESELYLGRGCDCEEEA